LRRVRYGLLFGGLALLALAVYGASRWMRSAGE